MRALALAHKAIAWYQARSDPRRRFVEALIGRMEGRGVGLAVSDTAWPSLQGSHTLVELVPANGHPSWLIVVIFASMGRRGLMDVLRIRWTRATISKYRAQRKPEEHVRGLLVTTMTVEPRFESHLRDSNILTAHGAASWWGLVEMAVVLLAGIIARELPRTLRTQERLPKEQRLPSSPTPFAAYHQLRAIADAYVAPLAQAGPDPMSNGSLEFWRAVGYLVAWEAEGRRGPPLMRSAAGAAPEPTGAWTKDTLATTRASRVRELCQAAFGAYAFARASGSP